MNQKQIVIGLVFGALGFAVGFIGGAILNRPSRQNYDAKIADIRSEAAQLKQAIMEKLHKAQAVIQGLEKEKIQLNSELRNMKTALREINKKVREQKAELLSVNNLEKQKEESFTKRKSTEKTKTDTSYIEAIVAFTGTQFVITNLDSFDWTNVKLEVNSGIIRGGYILRVGRLSSGQIYTVGASQFSKSNGERFNPFTHKPKNFTITCDDHGDVSGFHYGTWE